MLEFIKLFFKVLLSIVVLFCFSDAFKRSYHQKTGVYNESYKNSPIAVLALHE